MWNNRVVKAFLTLGRDILRVYWALLKVLIPSTIVVKILDSIGATEWLSVMLEPIMHLVGLPEEFGFVWAVAILTNIYMGMIVFYNYASSAAVSVADISILGTMILIAHAIPVEGAIAKTLGVKWRITIAIRVGGAVILGAILNQIYSAFELYQQPIQLVWQPDLTATPTLTQWAYEQVQILISVFGILVVLISTLRILRWLGIEKLIHALLMPLLRGLTLGKEAANITVVGMLLGISYGAGLLIDDVKQGKIGKREILLVMGFLGLCHSIIEDTLLIMLLGADLSAILWGRLLFAIVFVAIWGRLYKRADNPAVMTEPKA